jgi:hypothetical protein
MPNTDERMPRAVGRLPHAAGRGPFAACRTPHKKKPVSSTGSDNADRILRDVWLMQKGHIAYHPEWLAILIFAFNKLYIYSLLT